MPNHKRVGARARKTALWLVPRERREAANPESQGNRAQRRAGAREKARDQRAAARRGWR